MKRKNSWLKQNSTHSYRSYREVEPKAANNENESIDDYSMTVHKPLSKSEKSKT